MSGDQFLLDLCFIHDRLELCFAPVASFLKVFSTDWMLRVDSFFFVLTPTQPLHLSSCVPGTPPFLREPFFPFLLAFVGLLLSTKNYSTPNGTVCRPNPGHPSTSILLYRVTLTDGVLLLFGFVDRIGLICPVWI